jgi:curved DNA-binding protein CbpA
MMEKCGRSATCNHYELLDLEPSASTEEIKAAYFGLAKKLHPDHRSGLKVADPHGVFDELYLRVKAAYEVLSKDTERRRYDFQLEQRKPKLAKKPAEPAEPRKAAPERTFSADQMARIHFGNGQSFFAQERFHEAVEQFREAVRLEGSRAEYHRWLGQSLAKNPKWRRQAEEHLLRAIELNRFDATAYLELGDLYEQGGMSTRARKMYQNALGVDPDNLRAIDRLHAGANQGTLNKLKGVLGRERGN